MATPLKICIILHVEDSVAWDATTPSGKANGLSSLAQVVGTPGDVTMSGRNAKLSVQFGRKFLDSNAANPYPLGAPTAVRAILSYGGNFWTHTHSADYHNLVSNYNCVNSAYHNEGGPTIFSNGGPGGRSGGWDFDGADWVSITLAAGIRVMNSTAMGAHALVPLTMRPYGITDDEITKLHPKGPAPGPIYPDVMTMRQRPFWMSASSVWFSEADNYNPLAVGSVMMIPAPGKLDLNGLAEGRTAAANRPFDDLDLQWALSQAWATYEYSVLQDSIPNVWYTHLPIAEVKASTSSLMGNFVDSINAMFDMAGTPKAEWANMNEIASLFADPGLW